MYIEFKFREVSITQAHNEINQSNIIRYLVCEQWLTIAVYVCVRSLIIISDIYVCVFTILCFGDKKLVSGHQT